MTHPVQPVKSTVPRSERIARWILVVSFLLLIVVLAGMLIKVPYAVERPGPVTDTLGTLDDGSSLVAVKGAKTYPTEGSLYFTTVRVVGGPERHISGWEWVMGHLDDDSRVVPEEQLFPADTSEEEIEEMNAAQMQGSQKNSIAVGLRSTGATVPQVNVVGSIATKLPAKGKLELEDEIVSVDGSRTRTVADIVDKISARSPGDDVEIVVRRDGRLRTVKLTTADLGGGRAGVGIGVEPQYDYPVEVRIDAGRVGGPSAGMMFALAVRDRLVVELLYSCAIRVAELCGLDVADARLVEVPAEGDPQVVGAARAGDAMGQFGRLSKLADLPGRRDMGAQLKRAMALIEAGVPKSAGPARARKPSPSLPDDLAVALAGNPAARTTYEGFPPGQQREYVEWIQSAKREPTRRARVAQAVEWMAQGRIRNWKYVGE